MIPTVEVPDQTQRPGGRRPFAIPDAGLAVALAPVEAEVVMALADRPQEPAVSVDASPCRPISRVALVKPVRIGLQPGIEGDKAQSGRGAVHIERLSRMAIDPVSGIPAVHAGTFWSAEEQ